MNVTNATSLCTHSMHKIMNTLNMMQETIYQDGLTHSENLKKQALEVKGRLRRLGAQNSFRDFLRANFPEEFKQYTTEEITNTLNARTVNEGVLSMMYRLAEILERGHKTTQA